MGNQLFQQARDAVHHAVNNQDCKDALNNAKNALSSAYANSTISEKRQLRELQDQLDQLNVK